LRGRFITFEGGEGSGKSTQIKRLESWLLSRGIGVVLTREPGGVEEAEALRNLLLQGAADRWDPISETLLFQAARIQHVRHKILPALERGYWVLCDRFLDSTLVYQGIGKGVSQEWIRDLYLRSMPDIFPDLTILLDIDVAAGLYRAKARADKEQRFENMQLSFHEKVRQGFLAIAESEPIRLKVIDASGTQDEVTARIVEFVRSKYNLPE
jgi:dTMP kinase